MSQDRCALVKRMRRAALEDASANGRAHIGRADCNEAADALEQQAAEIARLHESYCHSQQNFLNATEEVARLTAERDALRVDAERVPVKVKRELFRFSSQQDWVNKAQSWYANCGVRKGHYITLDAAGHIMHIGKCFMAATERGLYPVTVYELQTNWIDAAREST